MAIILCATRGGEASSKTEYRAIELAKERGDTLLFLYIVNKHFLDKTAAPIVVDVDDELSDMGEFLLLMARERAEQQGVNASHSEFIPNPPFSTIASARHWSNFARVLNNSASTSSGEGMRPMKSTRIRMLSPRSSPICSAMSKSTCRMAGL